jgi:hypothetical protein
MAISTIHEPARDIPVIEDCDLCVLGGSCTGVFAAIRAARLGLRVVIVERMGCFGGVATLSLVNLWHSPMDETFEKDIIGGLTLEVIERLKVKGAVTEKAGFAAYAWAFNASEMEIELDRMIVEHGVVPWLHTSFVAPHVVDGELQAVIVENKSGRGAIRARFFIDATGDGDLCHRLGLETYRAGHRQPSTTCAVFSNWTSAPWESLLREHREEFGLPEGFAWGARVPGSDLFMLAGTRVHYDCADACGLTHAEIEGRRQVRAIHDLLRKYAPAPSPVLQTLPSRIGIRATRHVSALHRLTGAELLEGRRFPDAIANGSYRVDIHHDDKPGITFRYLDGRETYLRPGFPYVEGRWREVTETNPTFYQIPYRSLVPKGPYTNLLAAGRFIDADETAHGAIRVMVNMNQTGEAAGVAAWLALESGQAASVVNPTTLRGVLAEGRSIMI